MTGSRHGLIARIEESYSWVGISARKVEARVILKGYGKSIPSSWTEPPYAESCDYSLINVGSHTLKQLLFHYLALFVDGELNYHVTLFAAGQLPSRNPGRSKADGEPSPDLVTFRGTVERGTARWPSYGNVRGLGALQQVRTLPQLRNHLLPGRCGK